MRVSRWLVLGAFLVGAGCADILGIDDGTPRAYDASLEGGSDAAPDVKDAAAPDDFVPLHCGPITCNFGAGESCCWESDGGFACQISQTACDGTYIPCDRSEQCAQGDSGPIVCCGHYVSAEGGAIANDVACLPASQCTSAASRFVLCGDDSGAECPADASCQLSAFTLPTFLFCR